MGLYLMLQYSLHEMLWNAPVPLQELSHNSQPDTSPSPQINGAWFQALEQFPDEWHHVFPHLIFLAHRY